MDLSRYLAHAARALVENHPSIPGLSLTVHDSRHANFLSFVLRMSDGVRPLHLPSPVGVVCFLVLAQDNLERLVPPTNAIIVIQQRRMRALAGWVRPGCVSIP